MYQRYIKLLTREDRKRRDRRIPRSSLRPYCQSPFRFLFDSGNNQALINATGLNHEVFNDLLRLFEPLADNYCLDQEGNIKHVTRTRKGLRKGRHRSIDATGILGLVLMWYRTRGSCSRGPLLVFGLPSSTLYRWLNFPRRLLLSALINHPEAKVCLPHATLRTAQPMTNESGTRLKRKKEYERTLKKLLF